MSSPIVIDRPVPLRDAFKTVGSAVAWVGGVVTALAGFGILTVAQGDAVTGLLGAIPGVVTLATALLSAFGVVKVAEPQVTPSSAPMAEVNGELVPLVVDGSVVGHA